MKIATKLTKRVAEFVKEVSGLDYEYAADKDLFFHYPNFINQLGFENNYHLSGRLKINYQLVSYHDFIDIVTAELAGKTDTLNKKEMKTKCIVLGQENEPKPIVLKEIVTDQFTTIECNLNTSYFKKLIFDTRIKKFKGMDLIVGVSGVDRVLLLGHWNDGVV